MNAAHFTVCALVALASKLAAQHGWEISLADGTLLLAVRPSLETTAWAGDAPTAALLDFHGDSTFIAPRFTLGLDAALGSHWFLHTATRWDRGFDPGERSAGDLRLDELILRFRPLGDARLNLQLGRFPTVFGATANQQDFFDNPFLLAPLPYAQTIGIHSRLPGPLSPAAIAARASGNAPPVSQLDSQNWASVIWGSSYALGAAVTGSIDHFDYALELKNASLSSHPDSWTLDSGNFSDPTLTARLGYRPTAAWALGLSASKGAYLDESASQALPPGKDLADLQQTTLGLDLRWAHRDLILSGEVIASRFETLDAGDLECLAWFIQARWKAAPGAWLAGRFGQIHFNDARGPADVSTPWSPDVWRAEIAAGWQITPHILLKVHHSYTHTTDDDSAPEHLTGFGLGWQL
ncbi:MAG: hypothetical protein EAZ42_03970 [Verrucomicrobia bacterium]|nr:MAG: hypothetical protein EAZ42_03970 [Verrucomicrobiota bacterium]